MEQSVYELINDQINKELYSGYLYLSIADYYADAGLDGYANYFFIQAQEERDHALIFRNYLLENDRCPKLGAIEAPDFEPSDFVSCLHKALEHEEYVTSLINAIYAEATAKNDYRACQFLKWFIDEQMEEEDNARSMITKFELFGDDKRSLYELDQEYAARTYTQATPLANNN
jgi:ferritin